MLLPICFVCWLSVFANEILSFPPEGYTLRWFAALWRQPQFADGFATSFEVGVLATAGGLAVGIPASLALVRAELRFREALNTLLLSPLMVPGIVTGTALYLFFVDVEMATELPLKGSISGLVLGHILITIPWTVRLIAANLVGVDRAIEEAAMNLGCPPWKTFLTITLPLIAPALVSGWMLAFTLSLDDLVIASFTTGPGATTLPIRIYSEIRLGVKPEINAVCTVVIAFVALGIVAASLLGKLQPLEHKRAVRVPAAA